MDTQHKARLTERWKDIAIKTNNDSLLAKLATGSLASNELFYHLDCYSSMSRNYQRIIDWKDQLQIEEHWIKPTSFESIITFIIEEEGSQKGLSFIVRELNEMYIHMLRERGISEMVNTTRFVAKFIESLPNLHWIRRKDGKTTVMFDQQVDNLIRDSLETPDEFCASLRKVVNPFWKAIFEKKNNFDGQFEPLCQSESMAKSILRLISSLIDGTYDSNEYSQEAVTVAQLITSHASRSRRKRVPDFLSKVSDKLIAWKYIWPIDLVILDHFFHLGICVFYERVLEIIKNINEKLRLSYFSHNCWFASILKKVFLLYWLKDNNEVNARSNFVSSHYHGTSISIIQFVTDDNTGLDFPEADIWQDTSLKSKRLSPLPQEYINVEKLFAEKSSSKSELCGTSLLN